MMKWLLYLLLILTSHFVFADGKIDIPQPADLDLVEEELLLEAISAAQDAVRNSPDDAEAWGYLGHVYLSHGWEVPAIPCYSRASSLAPEEFKWLYFLGRLTQQRHPEAAVKHLTRALTLDATYAPAHLYLASALRILGKFDTAQQHLVRAKRLQPDNPFSELWLGEIALAKQNVKLARTHLEEALRLNPGQSEAHALMAQIALTLGDKQVAKQHAQAARRASQYGELSDPMWWDVLQAGVTTSLYAERGRRYMSKGDYVSAVAEFELLISDDQKDADLWLDYGIALLHTGKYSQALTVLERVKTLLRSNKNVQKQKKPDEIAYLKAQVYYYIAQIYYETGHPDAAIRTGQKAVQLLHNLIEKSQASEEIGDSRHLTFLTNVYANLALVYEDAEQLGQAIIQYQKALELLPTEPSLHRDLAGVYWKERRYAEAKPHYAAVIADNATDVQAIYRLGLIFLTKGDYKDAVAQFEQVIALETGHVGAYEALGIAYQKRGANSKAIEAFEKALQLEPNNKNVLKMLKQLHEVK
ncbi:tetratricopeptide repeat protein [Candidatus Poribacteria bacterium]|nr:tetratricopeptide repeat protein [Candidatus Poribacteria bacterium]